MFEFLKEFFIFLVKRKKIWIYPIVIFLLTFGFLIVPEQGTEVAPFIYTLF